jgi:hypothetical protein
MDPAFQFKPCLQTLEERAPLSSLAAAPAGATDWRSYYGQHWLPLSGQVSGTWNELLATPDAGPWQQLSGTGTVTPPGSVQASGSIHGPGFIANGLATGEMTFTDSQGSVTIRLEAARREPGFGGIPVKFYYAIEGGTGAYAKAWGGGIAYLTEQPSIVPPPAPPGSGRPDFIIPGTFTLKLIPNT